MGRNLSPVLRRELENLDKDADSRKSAMKALKSYVKGLDSKAIPLFLAQVSETKEVGSSGEYTISLYEVLARVHGPKIVPQINNIMATIIKTLTASAGSFALHQACSKVVPAIARYGIDPTTPEEKKRYIIHSLCKPLSDCLLGSQESLSSGAALCLKALVDSDNWRFASGEMVNEVCQKVVGALEKSTQTNSHMGLIFSLAKHNGLVIEAYARLLIQCGLRILNMGIEEGNSQKRLSAIQMINYLMKCLDPKGLFSELELIIEEMEKCQSDQMAFVSGAAFEALQTARRIATDKVSKSDRDVSSTTGSNSCTIENIQGRDFGGVGDQSSLSASPESQIVDSFLGYDSLIESPISVSQAHSDRRSVNCKLSTRYDNGGVDVSLKDGLFSEVTRGSATDDWEDDDFCDGRGDHRNGFTGFNQGIPRNGIIRSTTPSPEKCSHINIDNVKIFTTPRKLFRSLQDPNAVNSDLSDKQIRRLRSPTSKCDWSPASKCDQNSLMDLGHDNERNENLLHRVEHYQCSCESVSSTEDAPVVTEVQVSTKVVPVCKADGIVGGIIESHPKLSYKTVFVVFVLLFLVSICMLWIDDQSEGYSLVPT